MKRMQKMSQAGFEPRTFRVLGECDLCSKTTTPYNHLDIIQENRLAAATAKITIHV